MREAKHTERRSGAGTARADARLSMMLKGARATGTARRW